MAITIDAGVLGVYQYQAGPLMRQVFQHSHDQILNPEEEEGVPSEQVSWDDLNSVIEASCRSSLYEIQLSRSALDQYNTMYQQEIYGGGSSGGERNTGRRASAPPPAQGLVSWDDLGDAIEAGLQTSVVDLAYQVVEKQEWRPSGGSQPNSDEQPWECSVCTAYNENGTFLTCGVCNQPRR